MSRPRNDGRTAAAPLRAGKPRPTASGGTWRVRAYSPTPTEPNGRVTYRRPETGTPTSARPEPGQSLDTLFDQIERALDQSVATGPDKDRSIITLGGIYLDYLTARNRSPNYIDGRRCLLTKWVYPVIGDVKVSDWSTEHTEKVALNADPHIGAARMKDLGSVLSGLRKMAHRRRDGVRWLSLNENPLEDVSFTRRATEQGASKNWGPRHGRPSTERVRQAIAAAAAPDPDADANAGKFGRWEWMAIVITIAAFCALRLGEQLGLRAVDVHLDTRSLDVNGAWQTDNKKGKGDPWRQGRRVPTKTDMMRVTPYTASLHAPLLAAVTAALGLPEGTDEEEVCKVQEVEPERRAALVTTGDWRE